MLDLYADEIRTLELQVVALTVQRDQLDAALRDIQSIAKNARNRPTTHSTLLLIEKIVRDAPLEPPPRDPTIPDRRG